MNPPYLNETTQLFIRDKQAWENAIASYQGPDPLELWYNYICWYDYNVHVDPENKFRESLEKCLTIFEHNENYKQDVRIVKLWVKYVDLQPNPLNLYQILYQRGVGTQCACFYIGWAHYYDSANAFKQAESVYNLGFQAKAEPYSELQEAHTKFRLSLSQRMLYDDSSSKKRSASHLSEQRQQITTLTPGAKKLRAGLNESAPPRESAPVPNKTVPQIQQTHSYYTQHYDNHSHQQQPFQETQHHQHVRQAQTVTLQSDQQIQNLQEQNSPLHEQPQSQQTLYQPSHQHHYGPNSQQQMQTNQHTANNFMSTHGESEQGNLKKSAYVISSSLNYIYDETHESFHEDLSIDYPLMNVKLPPNFVRYTKNNHETWKPLLCLEEPYDPNKCCAYQKNAVYPGNDIEYSPEEVRAFKWTKRLEQIRAKAKLEQCQEIGKHVKDQSNGFDSKVPRAITQRSQVVQESSDYEQIEASTIRFSTDTNGTPKNKTITIKFRREKPSTSHPDPEYRGTYFITPTDHQSIDRANSSYEQLNSTQNHGAYADKSGSLSEKHSRHSMKAKKVKKIKFVNNYDDPKYHTPTNSNSNSCSSDSYHPYKMKQITCVSKNQYEDANLLLSLANAQSKPHNGYIADRSGVSADHYSYNDDSVSNSEFNSPFENNYLSASNCSTPVRKLSQTYSKSSTPYFRNLNKHTSNLSVQNDDSMCGYEQNSMFAAETNDELKQKRLEKALATIETHFAKTIVDPFSTELCKAFLTKIGFPSRDTSDIYRMVNTPIPKLANTKTTTLDNVNYTIEKEVGRGSYGSVYKAINNHTGANVALKYQKPPNIWEVYICMEVRKRITNYDILPGFMELNSAIIAPNASILVTEFSSYGSLLDINNKLRQATKKVMNESLVMHFSSQILDIVSHLHSCNIIHADIKPDNFLLMRVPSTETHIPSLQLIDFGCAIDMNFFPEKTQFKKVVQTDGFTCIEMQEGRPWSFQTDLFCIAGTVHVMLFGEYMQLVNKFGAWDIKQKLPRYLKKHVWTDFFSKMLNIKDLDNLPNLSEMRAALNEEVSKMDSELQIHIRTLSNLLRKR